MEQSQKRPVTLIKGDVRDRMVTMNWHFGKGDITHVDFDSNAGDHGECEPNCTGTATQTVRMGRYGGRAQRYTFRIVDGTLLFLGHQSNLYKPFVIR